MSGVIPQISLIMGPCAGMNDGYHMLHENFNHNVFTSNNVVFTCESSSFNQCPLPACGTYVWSNIINNGTCRYE